MDSERLNLFKRSLDDFINANFEEALYRAAEKKSFKARGKFAKAPRLRLGTGTPHENLAPLENMAPLESCTPRSLDDVLSHIGDTFQEKLFYHIDTKGLDDVEVYTRAHIDRRLFSKIRSNKDFKPSKKTAICLCFGLELELDDALDLLNKAGYTLSHSSKTDLIVEYFLKTGEYDLCLLNEILYGYGLDIMYV